MDDNTNLGMGLFDSDADLELNLFDNADEDYIGPPAEDEEEQDENIDPSKDINWEDQNNKPSEDDQDDDSEKVAGEEDEEGNDKSDKNDTDDTSPNIYSSFASVLQEEGLLPSLNLEENEIKDASGLINSIKAEIETQSKSYLIDKIGEDGVEALEKGISLAEYQQHQQTSQAFDQVTDEMLSKDLELAKRIVHQDYINQGIDERRATRLLKKSIDLGEDSLLEDAKESLESLKEFQAKQLEKLAEERAAQQKAQQLEQEKIDNDLKNTIYNSNEFIKGLKVDKAVKDRVYSSITKIVGTNDNGLPENKLMRDRRENPIEFDTKLYYLYEMTKGFKDFSTIMNKTESKALSELEKGLRQNRFDGGSGSAYMDDPDSYGGIGDEIIL